MTTGRPCLPICAAAIEVSVRSTDLRFSLGTYSPRFLCTEPWVGLCQVPNQRKYLWLSQPLRRSRSRDNKRMFFSMNRTAYLEYLTIQVTWFPPPKAFAYSILCIYVSCKQMIPRYPPAPCCDCATVTVPRRSGVFHRPRRNGHP
jgi:hypothetical protein